MPRPILAAHISLTRPFLTTLSINTTTSSPQIHLNSYPSHPRATPPGIVPTDHDFQDAIGTRRRAGQTVPVHARPVPEGVGEMPREQRVRTGVSPHLGREDRHRGVRHRPVTQSQAASHLHDAHQGVVQSEVQRVPRGVRRRRAHDRGYYDQP